MKKIISLAVAIYIATASFGQTKDTAITTQDKKNMTALKSVVQHCTDSTLKRRIERLVDVNYVAQRKQGIATKEVYYTVMGMVSMEFEYLED